MNAMTRGCNKYIFKLCLLVISLLPVFSQADIYKWVDEKGKIHFSDEKPKNEKQDVESLSVDELPGNFYTHHVVDYDDIYKKVGLQLVINIETINYRLAADEERYIKALINRIYDVYESIFGWPSDQAYPVNIKLFGREDEYLAFRRQVVGNKLNVNGFYVPSLNIAAVKDLGSVHKTRQTILHEASHAILDARANWTPKWINEGLAEYFETAYLRNGKLRNRLPKNKKIKLTKLWESNSIMTITEFFAIPKKQWYHVDDATGWTYYVTAWSIVSYMMDNPKRRAILSDMIKQSHLRRGNFSEREYVMTSYQGGLYSFSTEWMNWIKAFIGK